MGPIYNNFEGEARAEKTPFSAYFSSFACGAEQLSKIESRKIRARKINLVDLKKSKKFNFFSKIHPPPTRSAPELLGSTMFS